MRWLERQPVWRFALTVAALLPVCFLLWTVAAVPLSAPALASVAPLLKALYPGIISEVSLRGSDVLLLTLYGENAGSIGPMDAAGNQLGFTLNSRILSYSIPFYAALHFATHRHGNWGVLGWNLIILWILLAIGLLSTALKELMLGLGNLFLEQAYVPPADAIALLYQFSTLIVPPLAPVLLWAYAAADSPLGGELWPSRFNPAQDRDDSI